MTRLGIHVSRLEPDRTGKDFILEHFVDEKVAPSLDLRKGLQVTNVQVKSTQGESHVRIKLSSLEWLVFSDEPSFLLIVQFDSQKGIRNWFVREVDQELVTRSLKALRKLSEEDNGKSASKIYLNIALSSCYKIKPSGSKFNDLVSNCVGGSIAEYRRGRQHIRETAGYEGYPATGNVSFELEDSDQFAEALLGMRSLKLVDFSLLDNRFGIPVAQFDSRFSGLSEGSFKVTPHPSGEILLQSIHPDEKPAELKLNIYGTERIDEKGVYAIKAWNSILTISALSISADAEKSEQKFNISIDERESADTVCALINLLRNSADGEGEIRFVDPKTGKVFLVAKNLNADSQLLDWARGQAQNFVRLVSAGVVSNNALVSLGDIAELDWEEVSVILALLDSKVHDADFELDYNNEFGPRSFESVSKLVLVRSFWLGGALVVYAMQMTGSIQAYGTKFEFKPSHCELLSAELINEPNENSCNVFASKIWQGPDRLVLEWPIPPFRSREARE